MRVCACVGIYIFVRHFNAYNSTGVFERNSVTESCIFCMSFAVCCRLVAWLSGRLAGWLFSPPPVAVGVVADISGQRYCHAVTVSGSAGAHAHACHTGRMCDTQNTAGCFSRWCWRSCCRKFLHKVN